MFLIAMAPLMLHAIDPNFDITIGSLEFLDYRESTDDPSKIIGPFGLGAAVFSLLVPLGIGLAVGIYMNFRSKSLNRTKCQYSPNKTRYY